MAVEDVKKKTTTNFIWKFAERCGAQGVTFIVGIILARLLEPEDYGTIALITVFITLMNVFVDSGMGNALIRKKDADDLDFSSVFYFNMVMCLALYALMFFLAPLIASFYEDDSIVPLIRVLSLTIVISGVRSIQNAYVSKNMLFKKFFYCTIGATIGAAAVGIGMAYAGYGVWALVGQQLFNTLIGTVILWVIVKWRPKWMFSFARLKELFSFGWKLLVSSLIEVLYQDIRQLIIGKKYSSEDLAYYNKGEQFPKLIVANVNTSIDGVLFPTMAKVQDDSARLKQMTRRSIRLSTYIMAPLMIGLAVCAEPIILLLLTEKWLFCVPFMRIFCITYLFYPIHTANLNAIKVLGRSDYFLKLEIAKKIVGFSLILTTMWISVEAMAYSLIVATLASSFINAFPNKKLLKYSWGEQMKDILPNILLACVMGLPVFFMSYLPLPTILVLILQVIVGASIYIGLSVLLKLEIFTYVLDMVKGFFKKRKKSNSVEEDLGKTVE